MTRCKATESTNYGQTRCRKGKNHRGQHSGGEFALYRKVRWGRKEDD